MQGGPSMQNQVLAERILPSSPSTTTVTTATTGMAAVDDDDERMEETLGGKIYFYLMIKKRVCGFVFFTHFRPFGVDLQNFFFH